MLLIFKFEKFLVLKVFISILILVYFIIEGFVVVILIFELILMIFELEV